jgi:aspartyl protease family protein
LLFVGIALLVAAGLTVLVSADAGKLIGLTQMQTAQVLPLVILLIVFAGGVFSRRARWGELIGGLAMWAAIFVVAAVGYTYKDQILDVASRVVGELQPGTAIVDSKSGTVEFRRGLTGHFLVNANIDGTSIPLIFDTGATAMVLTAEDARRAGIDTSVLRFSVPVQTANGTGQAAVTTLDTVEIGGIVRHNVRAFIEQPGLLDTSLLGQTFLETLSRYSVTPNALQLTD